MTGLAPIAGLFRAIWPGERSRRRDSETVSIIRERADSLRYLNDLSLAATAESVRDAVRNGAALTNDNVLIPAFALVCESARRSFAIEYYDVQILAGLVLARGTIAEVATGEGKTLIAAFPAFLHSLRGHGVHVMTVNRYLAERDHAILSPMMQLLGATCGVLQAEASSDEKRRAYGCDITYGPGYEFGFDYLRDQAARFSTPKLKLGDSMRLMMRDQMPAQAKPTQRGHAFAIVDEADSVLIDEATTPLVLAGGSSNRRVNPAAYEEAHRVAASLVMHRDFLIDEVARSVRLTESGTRSVNGLIAPDAARLLARPWACYVEQALYADRFLKRDVDYIVRDGRVVLVDAFTGRLFADRTLRDGLHQAVECKERVEITGETQSIAHISRQRFMRLYRGMCGMTGTAAGSESELREIYKLNVLRVATRLPCRRIMLPTRFFANEAAKWDAVVREVQHEHQAGRPVLVGTRTIHASETLAERLRQLALPFRLLNGRQDEPEARIVAAAGQPGAITIATNMAGRGTDIKLGTGVSELGGLHVIGTECHESARVDRQLAGRAARQGDPGSCQFFLSADDHLVRRFGPQIGESMKRSADPSGECSLDFTESVRELQHEAERQATERRRQLFMHDHWEQEVLRRLTSEKAS